MKPFIRWLLLPLHVAAVRWMSRAGLMLWCSDSPDMTAANEAARANTAIGGRMADLAEKQYSDAQGRQATFDPKFVQLIDSSLKSQTLQDERSKALFDEWGGTADVRQKMYDTARNYDTPGRRNEEAATARAAVDTQFAANRQSQQRALGRAGVGLTAGRALTLDNANRFAASKAAAGADVGARRAVEATGMSLVDNAAKTSMGLPSTGLQAAGLAVGAGSAAAGGLGAQQGAHNASIAPSMGLFSGATGANTSAGNLYGQIAGLQQQGSAQGLAGLAGLGQAAGMMYGSGMFSSKKLKKPVKNKGRLADVQDAKIISETPAADAVASVPSQGWQYKKGLGDDAVHVGPYAEDVQASMGDQAAPGGQMVDAMEMAKINAQAIRELSAQVDALAQELEAA